MTKILITGATGHAGSHLAERIVSTTDWEIISLQRLPESGLDRLAHLPVDRIRKVYHDFRAPLSDQILHQLDGVRYVVHSGALVPNALTTSSDPELLTQTNTVGTFHMLEAARVLAPEKFLYTSTGQVLGPGALPRKESAPLAPPHVYAATKAAGELLCGSYYKSFGVPVITTRVMNLFGERQQATKFIAGAIRKLRRRENVNLHTDVAGVSSLNQWLHATEYADALLYLLGHGTPGETYHIAGEPVFAEDILKKISAWDPDYPVHISKKVVSYLERCLLDGSKLTALGWSSTLSFEEKINDTIAWTLCHPEWL